MSIINSLHAAMLARAKHETASTASLFNISNVMSSVIYKPVLRFQFQTIGLECVCGLTQHIIYGPKANFCHIAFRPMTRDEKDFLRI